MKKLFLLIVLCIPSTLVAQSVVLKGIVHDDEHRRLPLATVLLLPDSVHTSTDVEGNFSMNVRSGNIRIVISYIGHHTLVTRYFLTRDTSITFVLQPKVDELNEVVVSAHKYAQSDLFESTRSGTTILTQKDINAIPVLGGEADVIKTLQLLPGTLRGVEGSTDLFVRGGAADQNLVLLDNSPVYNTSHLFGFLSVFNPDILDKVEAINSAFPAEYGGRLSSILDVQTNGTVARKARASGDIGLISSRLFLEQPLIKNKASIWISGRRTYVDQVVKSLGQELPYFFYDLNGKIVVEPTSRDKVLFSYYGGEDILDIFRDRNGDGDGYTSIYGSGSSNQSLQWKRKINSTWNSSLSLIRSAYQYNITNAFEENKLLAFSDIEDIGTKLLISKDSVGSRNAVLHFGFDWTRHNVSPNVVNTSGIIAQFLEGSRSAGRVAHELAFYAQEEWSLTKRIRISTGIRTSATIVQNRTYVNPEPRVSLRYAVSDRSNVKLSYSRMAQYLHRVSSSAISLPTDIWYPVTDEIKPQTANQVSAAFQHFLLSKNIFFSVETYYKQMRNMIGYEEGTNLFFNADFESKLIQGKGKSYGLEFLLRKQSGKLTGWISYTLSWSWRQFDGINEGEWFRARYDRRHNGAFVAQYAFSKRWAASLVWEYISGSRFTPVIGQYAITAPTLTGIDLISVYAPINSIKLADTHRLDVGIKFKSKPDKRFQWQWFAGVYNTYNRANPVAITVERNETDGSLQYEQPGLFGLLPFISYGFKF